MTVEIDASVNGLLNGNRRILAKTITLIESSLSSHQVLAQAILDRLLPHTGKAVRLGITGVPGVGKSSFIESLGMLLVEKGHRVAVLAVDPSSTRSGGSILADKTRMERLSADSRAFIRPSPSGGTLGGVARKTRETMLVCEAAGFDVIIVETVGVGQSEITVSSMVDFFLVLMLAGAGDELQGIKKGVLELADAIAINKADGDNIEKAGRAKKDYETALHLLRPASPNWSPPVLTCSARETDRHRGYLGGCPETPGYHDLKLRDGKEPQVSVSGLDVVAGGRGAERPVSPSPGSSAPPAPTVAAGGKRDVVADSGGLSIAFFA